MNPHIQTPENLIPANITYIPRLYKMQCHKMYLEHETPETGVPAPQAQQAAPYTQTPSPMHQGTPMP